MVSLTSGWAWVALPKLALAQEGSSPVQMRVLSHCPGGEVELVFSKAKEQLQAVLEVARGELTRDVDQREISPGQTHCSLILDLPEPHWTPGGYRVRARLLGELGELVWESPWHHCFTLRHLPWEG